MRPLPSLPMLLMPGVDAQQFVKDMRKQNKLIMGIGHRIKSLSNPDKRVEIIKQYAL